MGYRVSYLQNWIHVKFTGHVDACDIIEQANDPEFWDRLSELKVAFIDYSESTSVEISYDSIKEFATVARVQAALIGPVHIVTLIAGPDRLESALAYKKMSESQDWRVKIATTMDEAEAMLKEACKD